MKKVIIVVVWLVIFMTALTGSLRLISAPNTIENVVGIAILASIIYLSNRVFNYLIKKKHEK